MILRQRISQRERPKTTLATLQTRARRSRLLGESLADYLSERIEAEETYIKSLQKIQRKGLIPPSYDLELGKVTETLKRRFEIELEDLIKFHENLSKRLESEVIGTIREGSRVGENSLKQVRRGKWTIRVLAIYHPFLRIERYDGGIRSERI